MNIYSQNFCNRWKQIYPFGLELFMICQLPEIVHLQEDILM